MEWIQVADSSDCPHVGDMKRLRIQGKKYLLAHGDSGYFIVDEMCSHEDSSLYLGCVQGDRIKCSLHGSRFQLQTGEALDEPADEPLGTYPLKMEGTAIFMQC